MSCSAISAIFRPEREPGEDVRGELGLPREAVLLLYVGRLAQEKNTHTLFEAFRQLAREQPGRYHLLVVGDGTQRGLLQSAIRDLPSAITHLPYCAESRRLAQLYRAADLFVHPGVQETFGLVALEAQACGTPVIGIRGSYMDRIIQSDQTHWAAVNTSSALAAAIQGAGAPPPRVCDTRRGRPCSLDGRYSWTPVFDRLFDLYREVIREFRAC
jgi:alpha-1,6-mannosyltransferase